MANRVLVTEHIHPAGIKLLSTACEVFHPPDISVEGLRGAITESEGVLVRYAPISREVIAKGSKLRVIAKHGVGTDNIDIAAATERGVAVCNTPEANTEGVAELALALMLALSRNIVGSYELARSGRWAEKDETSDRQLWGKALALVGCGRIGTRLARKCSAAFEMKIYAYDPGLSREQLLSRSVTKIDSLEELLPLGEFVSVHTPLVPATRGIIGASQLSMMKRSAFLINTSRGPTVDEGALVQALQEGKITGAGLDVLENEPPASDNPLLRMKNVVVLPHMAASTYEAMENMALDAAAAVLAVLKGERPKHLLNPTVYE